MLKLKGLKYFLCCLGLLALTPRLSIEDYERWSQVRRPDSSWLEWHRFFKTSQLEIWVPGVSDLYLSSLIRERVRLVHWIGSFGHAMRALMGKIPPWIVVGNDGALYLRDEVPDEYESPKLRELRGQTSETVTKMVAKITKSFQAQVGVAVVPTKILANRVLMGLDWVSDEQKSRFEIDNGSRKVGAQELQREWENELTRKGVSVLSILKEMLNNEQGVLPFPKTDSHWSREKVIQIGRYLVQEWISKQQIPVGCFYENKEWSLHRKREKFLGDLYGYLLVGNFLSKKFESMEWRFEGLERLSPSVNRMCPNVLILGTSYGEKYLGENDLGMAVRLFYKGEVQNLSINGGGILGSVERALRWWQEGKIIITPGSLILWEFPFREVKLGVKR